jgi:hypothetical protein
MKEITLFLRFIVIGFMYIILFRLIKIMLYDSNISFRRSGSENYALEVVDAPDLSGISKGSIFLIRDETNIGRKEDNQIIVNDPYVSGNHAIFSISRGKLMVRDLGSTNGTLLNGIHLEDKQEIYKDDLLEIGRITFKVIG